MDLIHITIANVKYYNIPIKYYEDIDAINLTRRLTKIILDKQFFPSHTHDLNKLFQNILLIII